MNGTEYARVSGSYSTAFIGTWALLNQDIASNKSTIRLYGYFYYGGGTQVVSDYSTFQLNGNTISSGYYAYSPGYHLLGTIDITVNHNSDGSFPNTGLSIYANSFHMSGSASGTITKNNIPSIPRQAEITNAPNFNDESNPTITYSNPAGNSVKSLQACISLTGSNDNIKYRDVSKTGTRYTFNLTDEERTLLRKNTQSNERTVTFILKTVIGSNTYLSKLNKTFSIINGNPTFNNFDFEDINPKTVALASSNKDIILNYSNIKVTISEINKAIALKEATMNKYRFENIDIPYSESGSVSGTVEKIDKGVVTVYAIDSRNNSTPVTKNANKIIQYTPLVKNSITATRDNGVSENVTLKFDGVVDLVDFGKVINSIKNSKYRYKTAGANDWSEYKDLTISVDETGKFTFNAQIKGDSESLGFNINNAYNIEVLIEDELSSVTFSVNLSSGVPHVAYAKNGVGIMGAYDDKAGGLLQVGGMPILEYEVLEEW